MDGELVQSFWNFDYFENKENVFQRKNLVTLFHPWHNTGLQTPTSKQHIFSTSQKWSQKGEKSWLKLDPPSPHCPECAAALQTPHSNAIEVARSSSCSSASSTRGCETESAPEMLADAPIGNRGARQWAALVLVGAPWCRSWAHSGTSKLSGRVGRDLVGRATTWTRGDPDKVTRPTSAELENLLRILIEYKGSAFQKFYSRKKNLLISMVCQFWRSRFFSKIS